MKKLTKILKCIIDNKGISSKNIEEYINIRNQLETLYANLDKQIKYLKKAEGCGPNLTDVNMTTYFKKIDPLFVERNKTKIFLDFMDVLFDIIMACKKKNTCKEIKKRLDNCESR